MPASRCIAPSTTTASSPATTYDALWSATQTFTRARIDEATRLTASLVHTAWWNAGRPIVPGSSLNVDPAAQAAWLEAWPLPFSHTLNVGYDGHGPFTLDVHDVRGVRVARPAEGALLPGTATWTPRDQRPGIYFVRLTTPAGISVRRVVRLD